MFLKICVRHGVIQALQIPQNKYGREIDLLGDPGFAPRVFVILFTVVHKTEPYPQFLPYIYIYIFCKCAIKKYGEKRKKVTCLFGHA